MESVKVAVSGAAGQLAYSLIFRLASGEVFGPNRPVELQLLEITPAMKALEGVLMELDDCAYPLLKRIDISDNAEQAFDGCNWALLVGSKPRGPGMERKDLILDNGKIFVGQGKALAKASSDLRVLVVGNPANTNCLIAMHNAGDVPKNRFAAMTRLDHNRAQAQLANKAGVAMSEVKKVTIWGNHSATQYPDFLNAEIQGKPATEVIQDKTWLEGPFIETVQKRGAAIIQARGVSSAASAASAAVDHVKSLSSPTPAGDWFSAGVCSDGSYGIPAGLIFSFPLTTQGEDWKVVPGLSVDSPFAKEKLAATQKELEEEREIVKDLL